MMKAYRVWYTVEVEAEAPEVAAGMSVMDLRAGNLQLQRVEEMRELGPELAEIKARWANGPKDHRCPGCGATDSLICESCGALPSGSNSHPEVCCDLHGVRCEPPSELCCGDCTEANHPHHPTGVLCVLDESTTAYEEIGALRTVCRDAGLILRNTPQAALEASDQDWITKVNMVLTLIDEILPDGLPPQPEDHHLR
jgi:hypothetical protein